MPPETSPEAPFVLVIRVGWADCDPARIAYTGRLPMFALEAIDAWWEHVLGQGWYQLNLDRDFGTPFVHLELDFRRPVTPRWRLACSVRPMRLGGGSIEFRVEGAQDGALCFEGRFVCAFVDAEAFKPIRTPDFVRDAVAPLLPG